MSSKIKDGLFMGDIDAAQDADFLQLNGIMHIVNCVPRQMPNIFQQSLGLSYTACNLEETLHRPFFDLKNREFGHIIQLIDRALDNTESVLVHSLNGFNRSPSIMIGYLMVKYCWGLDKAHEFVMTKRSDVKLHKSYIDQLCGLEAQIKEDRPARATDSQLYEWLTLSADSKLDEIVLIHTFLNSSSKPNDIGALETRRRDTSKHRRERRLTWIDQTSELVRKRINRKSSPSVLERPPNSSYNEMVPANGWVDLFDPSPHFAHIISNKITTSEGSNLHTARLAFADLSSRGKLDTAPSSVDSDQCGPEVDVGLLEIADVPVLHSNKRLYSFSAPKKIEIHDDEASTCPSTTSEEFDFVPGYAAKNRETLAPTKSHPRRLSSNLPRASLSTKHVSLPGKGRNNSFGNVLNTKPPSATLKGVTKKSGKRITTVGSRNLASGGRVFNSVDFAPPASSAAGRRSVPTGSVRFFAADQLRKTTPIRPRTAPPRIRTDVETKDFSQRKRVDLNGIGRVTIDPIKSHRLHSSLDYTSGIDLDASLLRGARRTSALDGFGKGKTARASWR
ncbi:putative Dual specificity phosphatase, protein-tyrosine phosphatase [Plasmopara halstedii]